MYLVSAERAEGASVFLGNVLMFLGVVLALAAVSTESKVQELGVLFLAPVDFLPLSSATPGLFPQL